LRFVVALRGYWPARGLIRTGHALAAKSLFRPGAETRDALRADALTSLAQLCWWLGEFTEARGHGMEALAIAEELGDAGLQASSSMVLSYSHGGMGDLAGAGRHAQEALRFARDANDVVRQSDALVALADFHFESGDLARARDLYEQAMALRSELDLPARQGLVAISLAEVAIAQEERGSAKHWLRKAAALAVETRSHYIGHHVIERCATLAAAGEEWSLAVRWFSASAHLRQMTGLSGKTMGQTQRRVAFERASVALGRVAAGDAERDGAALSYEQALEEVETWLD
jgi:tetratricopeptide (TPR) repeat protein